MSDDDLWLLSDPIDPQPNGPRNRLSGSPDIIAIIAEWRQAEASHAASLARASGLFGALDDRLRRGPAGWRQRLALIEAADLSWYLGDRVSADRLALWITLRLSGVQDDTAALARASWAVRRLSGGPGPQADLAAFLDRRNPEDDDADGDTLLVRADSWLELIAYADKLHPIVRAAMGFHLWNLAGLGHFDTRIEAAVSASRLAASEASRAVFVPLAMGGATGLRTTGPAAQRLGRWLEGLNAGCRTAMRYLDMIEAWHERAGADMAQLSGRTPAKLRAILMEWPLVSAPMAEALTGASRAAVQRNLIWMEKHNLIQEVTGQGRYKMWRAIERPQR